MLACCLSVRVGLSIVSRADHDRVRGQRVPYVGSRRPTTSKLPSPAGQERSKFADRAARSPAPCALRCGTTRYLPRVPGAPKSPVRGGRPGVLWRRRPSRRGGLTAPPRSGRAAGGPCTSVPPKYRGTLWSSKVAVTQRRLAGARSRQVLHGHTREMKRCIRPGWLPVVQYRLPPMSGTRQAVRHRRCPHSPTRR